MTDAHPLGRIIGHRGCAAHAPENSLEGITAAANAAADSVELDVRLTADGVPVLLHDARLDRTGQGRGAIAETPFRRLRADGPPPVDAALDRAEALSLGVNLEIKGGIGAARRTAIALRRSLARRRLRVPVVISSFDWGALPAFGGRWPVALLARRKSPALLCAARRLRAVALHLAAPSPGAPLPVAVYTVNTPSAAAAAARDGAAALFSDDPTAVRDAFCLAPRDARG